MNFPVYAPASAVDWKVLRPAEGLLLLLAAPFLLFPSLSLPLTTLFLLLLALTWLFPLLRYYRAGLPATPFNLALLIWAGSMIASMVVTADPELALPKAAGLILGLASWRYLLLVVRTPTHLYAAFVLFLFAALGFTLTGILSLQPLLKIPFLVNWIPLQSIVLPGDSSEAVHPNLLAGTICLFLPLLVALLISWSPRRYQHAVRLSLLLLTALVSVILLLTQSRGGWVAALFGLLALPTAYAFLLPPSPDRRRLRLVLGVLALAGLLTLAWVGPQRLQQLWFDPPQETLLGSFTTLNYRREIWPWALQAVADFPFTGPGLGAFRAVVHRLYPVTLGNVQDIGHAHNIFLQMALDFGLPGLIAYLAILLLSFRLLWRVACLDAHWRPFALGLIACLVAFHVFGLADAVAMGAKPSLLFWLLLALIAALYRLVQPAAHAPATADFPPAD
jgi:putative inorganic carbon (HCO3(-)) transporter